MSFSWINLLGYSLAVFPYVYFMNHYLMPKYPKGWTSLISGGILLVTIIITVVTIFDNVVIKLLFSLCSMYVIILCLYHGTWLKKVISPILMVTGIVIVEIPLDYCIIYFLKWDMNALIENSLFYLMFQIVANMGNILFFKFLIKLLNKNVLISKQSMGIYLILSIQFFALIYLVNQIPFMSAFHLGIEQRLNYIIMMLVVDVGASVIMMMYLHHLYKKLKVELSMVKLEKEYSKLLEEYKETNNEAYQYLRHDIMNYLVKQKKLEGDFYEKYD